METLETNVGKRTKTIDLMDAFEARDEKGDKIYDFLILKDVFCMTYQGSLYFASLKMKRKKREDICVESSLTFTEFKRSVLHKVFQEDDKDAFRIVDAAYNELNNLKEVEWNAKTVYCAFPVPVKFNAQNGANRCGYGNRYCGEELVYEGIPYGDTTDYIFIGVSLSKASMMFLKYMKNWKFYYSDGNA